MYKFKQLHKCQNGHENYLFFDLHNAKLVNFKWGQPECKCPKFKLGEGYFPMREAEIIWGDSDLKSRDVSQLPLKIAFEGGHTIMCPTCGNWRIEEKKYCCDCGQKLCQDYKTYRDYSGV